jgi:hypothetical protein
MVVRIYEHENVLSFGERRYEYKRCVLTQIVATLRHS